MRFLVPVFALLLSGCVFSKHHDNTDPAGPWNSTVPAADDPPLSRDLRDSALSAPYSVGAAGTCVPTGFPEVLVPDAVPGT